MVRKSNLRQPVEELPERGPGEFSATAYAPQSRTLFIHKYTITIKYARFLTINSIPPSFTRDDTFIPAFFLNAYRYVPNTYISDHPYYITFHANLFVIPFLYIY